MSCFQDGSPASPLMVVGMAPGKEELAKDIPFVGGSGRLFWSLAKKAGIDRADCYILNTIGVWPEGKTGDPTPAQFEQWWDRFDSAFGMFQGRHILLLGGAALWRVTGLAGGIEQWRGYLVGDSERRLLERTALINRPYKRDSKATGKKAGDPRWVSQRTLVQPPQAATPTEHFLPTLHPAGVLRSGFSTLPLLAADLTRCRRALTATLRSSRTTYVEYPVLRTEPVVALDIETGGALADFGNIVRVGVADSCDAWTLPWGNTARAAVQAMATPTTTCVFHNGGFDIPRLEHAGVDLSKRSIWDTMFGAALLQPDLKKGLNAAASQYLDCHRWKHLSDDQPAKYNALDAIRTFELHGVQSELMRQTGQHNLFTGIIMPALPVLIRMGRTGIRLDTSRQHAWLESLQRDALLADAEWHAATGGVNYASSAQLKRYFGSLGMWIPFNKYGAESLDKESLQKLRAENPQHAHLIDLLQRVKGLHKSISTYAGVAAQEGIVHPNFTPAFKDNDDLGKGLAGTWRITAKEPNLQNQPKAARFMYVPRPGMCFVGADYSQLEARILAAASGDLQLLADCDGGIHTVNAAKLGVDKTRAKNAFYGWSYLTTARTLLNVFKANGFQATMAECEALIAYFDTRYAKAAAHRQAVIKLAADLRYVSNGWGLRRYFPQQSLPAPAVASTYIQSSGAMMMWQTMPQHEQAAQALGGNILLMVHDDVLWEVPLGQEQAAVTALRDIMQQEFAQVAPGFRCPVTPKLSTDSWGAMEDVG